MFRSHRHPIDAAEPAPLPADLAKEVRRLHVMTRRRVSDLFTGEYHSAFKGHGIEFAEVREYEPGDDVRSIDWNVTARTGKTFIKRFVEERQLTAMVCVDLSRSGMFGTTGKTKRRLEIESAAILAMAASQNQDRVGLLLFTDRVEKFVPPKKGTSHCQRLMRDLLAHAPAGRGTDLRPALDHLAHMLRRRSVIFLISDFDCPPCNTQLSVLARRHDVVAISVNDPREFQFPSVGLVDVVDPETGATRTIDLGSRGTRAYAAQRLADRDRREAHLASSGVDRVTLSTERSAVPELAAYFRRRERRR
ncbi:MAG: DUF58 domain-containing protein [Phycisphaeraceae bacterium]|nr:MAG: DUF58 domain-containing protein [Phycisphaeraceae bacterium]